MADKTFEFDVDADYVISTDISSNHNFPKNDDGTEQEVSLRVVTSDFQFSLSLLNNLHKEMSIAGLLVESLMGDRETLDGTEDPVLAIAYEMDRIHDRFFTMEMALSGVMNNETHHVTLYLTAPSGSIAQEAFQQLTDPDELTKMLLAFTSEGH